MKKKDVLKLIINIADDLDVCLPSGTYLIFDLFERNDFEFFRMVCYKANLNR